MSDDAWLDEMLKDRPPYTGPVVLAQGVEYIGQCCRVWNSWSDGKLEYRDEWPTTTWRKDSHGYIYPLTTYLSEPPVKVSSIPEWVKMVPTGKAKRGP